MEAETEYPNPFDDRRASPRAATWRKAVLSLLSGKGSMTQGTALDLSRDGLRIAAPVPQPAGTEVEVFLPARPEHPNESPLTVVGRILWTAPHEGGLHVMGIRLYEEAPAVEDVRTRAGAEALMARVREELRARATGGHAAVIQISPVKRAAAGPRRRWRWIAALLLLTLLFLASFALMRRFPFHVGGDAAEAARPLDDLPALDQSQRALLRGDAPAALTQFEELARRAKTPAARLIAALGAADALRMQGRTQEAQAKVRQALDANQNAPKAWQDAAAQFREALAKSGEKASAPPLLVDAIELLRPVKAPVESTAPPTDQENKAAGAQSTSAQKEPPRDAPPQNTPPKESPLAAMRIEVDKSDFMLTLYRGDTAVASYPVGLGLENATPEGEFVIANKLLDPDWYNKGKRVKSGDPRNPLGRHWMGLGNDHGRTTYGIHETKESTSIGANLSRGCVRMRPTDAAELYRACAVGTPVRIVE